MNEKRGNEHLMDIDFSQDFNNQAKPYFTAEDLGIFVFSSYARILKEAGLSIREVSCFGT